MYQHEQRRMNAAEKERLHTLFTAEPPSLTRDVLLPVVAITVFALAFGWQSVQRFDPTAIALLSMAALGIVGYLLFVYRTYWQEEERLRLEEEEILNDGRVEVHEFEARDVVALVADDELDTYLFELTCGQVALVDLYDVQNADGPYPNTRFSIVETVVGDCALGVFCRGEGLSAPRHRAPETLDTWRLPDIVVVPGGFHLGFDELARRIMEHAEPLEEDEEDDEQPMGDSR